MNSVAISSNFANRRSILQSAIQGQRPEIVDKLLSWGVQPTTEETKTESSDTQKHVERNIEEELIEAKKIEGQIRSFETAIWFHGESKMWASKVVEMKAKMDELKQSPQFRTKKEIHQLEMTLDMMNDNQVADFIEGEKIAVAI